MGVSASGKTTVGVSLSKILSVPFYDADDYHNHKSIEKMRKGLSLSDLDRKPWLNLLALKIKEWNSDGGAILACSALKHDYRRILSQNNEVTFIFLDGEYHLIYSRMSNRTNNFFTKAMLNEQFSILERPTDCINIPINQSIEDICLMISNNLEIKKNEK
jgi:carbohydrate kinase (thermoresistant glucokinase family)